MNKRASQILWWICVFFTVLFGTLGMIFKKGPFFLIGGIFAFTGHLIWVAKRRR